MTARSIAVRLFLIDADFRTETHTYVNALVPRYEVRQCMLATHFY